MFYFKPLGSKELWYTVKRAKRVLKSKAEYQCLEEKDSKRTGAWECAQEFIDKKVGCAAPWSANGKGLRQCNTKDDLLLAKEPENAMMGEVRVGYRVQYRRISQPLLIRSLQRNARG